MEMKISEETLDEMYAEALDAEGDVKVAGMTFSPSRVLKELDPIAYRTGLSEYADFLIRDGYEVEGYN